MKKNRIIALVFGSALVAGATAFATVIIRGKKTPFRHDAGNDALSTQYKAEDEEPAQEQEEAVDLEQGEPEAEPADQEKEQGEPEEERAEQEEEPEEEQNEQGEPEAEQIVQDEEQADQEIPEAEPAVYAEYAAEQKEIDAAEEQFEDDDDIITVEKILAAGKKGPSNLEEYIRENPEEKANLDKVGEGFAAEGVKTDISFTDNTMFFDFVMTDVEDAETKEILKPDLEQFLSDQTENYKGIVKQIEEDTEFSDVKMIVIFMDANGEEIVSGHYDESGRTM
ncbi:MAG: DUF4854 domain-containing protein [Eubacterium sp.]|nr:DUF4854 domain-containing protein [Eubacterium sp.]